MRNIYLLFVILKIFVIFSSLDSSNFYLATRRIKAVSKVENILHKFGSNSPLNLQELPQIERAKTNEIFASLVSKLKGKIEEREIAQELNIWFSLFKEKVIIPLEIDLADIIKRFSPSFDIFSPLVVLGEIIDYGTTPSDMQEEIKKEREGVKLTIENLGYRVKRLAEDWPRDLYVLLSGETFSEEKLLDMWVAIGGNLVWSEKGRFLIISVSRDDFSGIAPDLKERIKENLDGKLKIYELPAPVGESFLHLDFFLGIFEEGKIILVDPDYYKENKAAVDEIAEGEGYKIVLIPEEEKKLRPGNFLSLPNGKVLMINAPKTYAEIARVIGQDKVKQSIKLLDSSLEANLKLGGGIRCMTTLTYPLISLLQVVGYGYDEISALIALLSMEKEAIYLDAEGRIVLKEEDFFAIETLYRFILRTDLDKKTKYFALNWIAQRFRELGKLSSAKRASEKAGQYR
ncbi:MAG: arginine deiminase-related protein [Candidatus Omnitrophica bacterium]|nr:arginine deiminase-related protein [Candidatus Omnitrophota bacterium]MCM8798230.1 arginine deiminase-related protein [Candidatus Omnitrophota bacterium]